MEKEILTFDNRTTGQTRPTPTKEEYELLLKMLEENELKRQRFMIQCRCSVRLEPAVSLAFCGV